MLGFFGEIRELWHTGLHLVSHLILSDAGHGFGITEVLKLLLIQGGQAIEHGALYFATDTIRIRHVEHRIACAAELHALVLGGQEAVAPVEVIEDLAARGFRVARGHHHKTWKFIAFAAKPIR